MRHSKPIYPRLFGALLLGLSLLAAGCANLGGSFMEGFGTGTDVRLSLEACD